MIDEIRDERGVDVAILAFVATLMAGGSPEAANRHATGMLELFGLKVETDPREQVTHG
jgi:hypothetical protein